jgi:hypothetical protein
MALPESLCGSQGVLREESRMWLGIAWWVWLIAYAVGVLLTSVIIGLCDITVDLDGLLGLSVLWPLVLVFLVLILIPATLAGFRG